MYLLIDNLKKKYDWKIKWYNILIEYKILRYLESLLYR